VKTAATVAILFSFAFSPLVADAATDVDTFYAQRRPLPAEETGEVLVGAVDGKGIPMRKPEKAEKVVRRKNFSALCFDTESPVDSSGRSVASSYGPWTAAFTSRRCTSWL